MKFFSLYYTGWTQPQSHHFLTLQITVVKWPGFQTRLDRQGLGTKPMGFFCSVSCTGWLHPAWIRAAADPACECIWDLLQWEGAFHQEETIHETRPSQQGTGPWGALQGCSRWAWSSSREQPWEFCLYFVILVHGQLELGKDGECEWILWLLQAGVTSQTWSCVCCNTELVRW